MKATLKVKNFGPIVDAEIDLRNVNVFIGPQASGKSTLAKLFAICKSPLNYFLDEKDDDLYYYDDLSGGKKGAIAGRFMHELKKMNIQSYLRDDTYFEYDSEIHGVIYDKGEITLERKLLQEINKLGQLILDKSIEGSNDFIRSYFDKIMLVPIYGLMVRFHKLYGKFEDNKISEENFSILFAEFSQNFDFEKESFDLDELTFIYNKLKETERKFLSNTTYVPAERIIAPILKGAALNLQHNRVPIPVHILSFAAEYEKSLMNLKYFDLSFLKNGYFFQSKNGEEHFYYNEGESVLLSESATGIQSLIPLLLPIFSSEEGELPHGDSYVIEEPEMNLYPKAQYNLIKYLESKRMEGLVDTTFSHLYTTHSPYILASFNNMLYAYKKASLVKEDKVKLLEIEEVMPKESWMNPENFNAYTIINGKAVQIFNRESGLIDDNVIDEVSEEMNDDFNALLEL